MTRTLTAKRQVSEAIERGPRPLTNEDRVTAFRIATSSFVAWYAGHIEAGMIDPELEAALENSLGIMGGSCGPGMMDVNYQGSGLRIWANWEITNHHGPKPMLAGYATVAMAREVYGIATHRSGRYGCCSTITGPASPKRRRRISSPRGLKDLSGRAQVCRTEGGYARDHSGLDFGAK